jgi:hypothetical protein
MNLNYAEIQGLSSSCTAQLKENYAAIRKPVDDVFMVRWDLSHEFGDREIAAGRCLEEPLISSPTGTPVDPRHAPDFPEQIVIRSRYYNRDRKSHMVRIVRINPGDDEKIDNASIELKDAVDVARMRIQGIINAHK